jgi:hypothetical protein
MTCTHTTSLAVATVLLLALSHSANAQRPPRVGTPPPSPPTFSPYLNLLRGGTNPAINYYGLVRPEFAWRRAVGQLGEEIQQTQADVAAQGGGTLQTGHPVQFLNLSHYYAGPGQPSGARSAGRSTIAPTYPTGTPAQARGPRNR